MNFCVCKTQAVLRRYIDFWHIWKVERFAKARTTRNSLMCLEILIWESIWKIRNGGFQYGSRKFKFHEIISNIAIKYLGLLIADYGILNCLWAIYKLDFKFECSVQSWIFSVVDFFAFYIPAIKEKKQWNVCNNI